MLQTPKQSPELHSWYVNISHFFSVCHDPISFILNHPLLHCHCYLFLMRQCSTLSNFALVVPMPFLSVEYPFIQSPHMNPIILYWLFSIVVLQYNHFFLSSQIIYAAKAKVTAQSGLELDICCFVILQCRFDTIRNGQMFLPFNLLRPYVIPYACNRKPVFKGKVN